VRCAALHASASASFAAKIPVAKRGSIGLIDDVLFRLAGSLRKDRFFGGVLGNEMMKHLHGIITGPDSCAPVSVCLWFGRAKVGNVTWDLHWDHGLWERANGKKRKKESGAG
jgi:hypothetical protein